MNERNMKGRGKLVRWKRNFQINVKWATCIDEVISKADNEKEWKDILS